MSGIGITDTNSLFSIDKTQIEAANEKVKDTAYWVQKLSYINIKLFQHTLSIPPVENHSPRNFVVFPDKQFAVSYNSVNSLCRTLPCFVGRLSRIDAQNWLTVKLFRST